MVTKSNNIKSKLQAQGATVIDGKSANIVADNIEAFKALLCSPELRNRVAELFPCAFADGELQMDALLQDMGKYAENVEDTEHYPISWHGKAKALQHAQRMTTATLRPCIEESVGKDGTKGKFDSQNLYIEGDNLEVLKVLERSYAGQIKMIYIDPPYNTGNDFIYKDKYADGIQTYLEYTGQKDDKGNDKSTKKETSGASHSNWLSMMYPRLEYARRLLSDDGVIFISIDDNEQANLKRLCDMVFNVSNFVSTINLKRQAGRQDSKYYAEIHEYILVYAKNINYFEAGVQIKEESVYPKYDMNTGRCYKTQLLRKWGSNSLRENRPNLYYPIKAPDGSDVYPIIYKKNNSNHESKIQGRWRWSVSTMNEAISKNLVEFEKNNLGEWVAYEKIYAPLDGEQSYKKYNTWLDYIGSGSKCLDDLFDDVSIFAYPKNIELIRHFLKMGDNTEDSTILDFFSGSATTAHSIMKQNLEDNEHRKYIMVQIPEPCNSKTSEGKAALDAGFKTIAEIGKERIRRAGEEIHKKNPAVDVGFKVFKLDSSNLKKWDDKPAEDVKEVSNRLLGAQDMMEPGRSHLDVVYEYMLKYGLTLDWQVECVKVHNKDVYVVAGGMFMVCLDHDLDKNWADELVKLKKKLDPADWRVLVADESFGNETKTRDNNAQNIFHTLCDAGLAPVNFIIA